MWLTVPECIRRSGVTKLALLTSNSTEVVLGIGSGDGGASQAFDLPFYRSSSAKLKIYADGTLIASGVALTVGGATNGNDRIVVTPSPASGKAITLTSDGVYVDDLNDALRRGQGEIRAALGAIYTVSTDEADPASVPILLKGWAWDLAAYYLVSDVKRAPLAASYPEIVERYYYLVGGGPNRERGELRWYGAGNGDLTVSGVPARDTSVEAATDTTILFVSEDPVFNPPGWYE